MDVEVEGLVESLVRAKAFHPRAHQAATLVIAEQFVKEIDKVMKPHNDTNRYINGWIRALHAAGLNSIPVKAYSASRKREEYLRILEEQYFGLNRYADKLRNWVSLYELYDRTAPPRKDGRPRKKRMRQHHVRKVVRDLRRAEKSEAKALEIWTTALENESILFFDRRAHSKRPRNFHTIRHKIFGGTGRIVIVGNKVIVELNNLEAHPRLVERNPKIGHPVRTAYNKLRSFGLRRASNRYMDTLEKLYKSRPGDAVVIVEEAQLRHAKRFAA